MKLEIFRARFIKEGHNRFIALYTFLYCNPPGIFRSSAKMSNFLKLNGKQILVSKNSDTSRRTKYSLFAVKYYNKYILLNLNLVNKLLEKYLNMNFPDYEFTLEKSIAKYKSDIVMKLPNGELTVIEAKGVISTNRSCIFPSKISDRAINQLLKLKELLLSTNINVVYYLVSLGPIVKKIYISDINSEYTKLLKNCIFNGMTLIAISIEYNGSDYIFKKLPIEFI